MRVHASLQSLMTKHTMKAILRLERVQVKSLACQVDVGPNYFQQVDFKNYHSHALSRGSAYKGH